MSSTVEERVVEMQFDNKQFESNAKETMKTLDALNKSLELKGATDGFKNLDKAAKSVDLSDISKSMDTITNKISVFGVIGDQVLRNLTNRATDFATKWAKDLTIGQVQKGWSKYEAKTNAVQVIMHATGQTINEVNESLDDLTWYTDQTSYSFDQMIDAISKFTGAGVYLEDAEKMAEGIANWAASAGVSASKAAPAFYNLSQAMSSGALRAQDWKSIELLNMNTVEFEEKAIEIAQAMIADGRASQEMATAFNKAKPKVQGFRDSLSTGWLSKEVMTELFKAYADRTTEFGNEAFQAAYEAKSFTDAVEAAKESVASGWANIFEQIFGNYEEAKVFWTEVADAMIEVFSTPVNALAELLTEWHKDGGYVAFIDSIRNAWAAVKSIGEEVAETFRSVIPPLTSDKLVSVTDKIENLTRQWRNFTTKIDLGALIDEQDIQKLNDGTADLKEYKRQLDEAKKHNAQVDKNMQSLRETFEGIFAVFKLAGTVTSALFKIAVPFTRLLVPIARIVGSITSALGRMSTTIVDAILESEIFNGVLGFLEKVANKAADGLTWLANKVADFIAKFTKMPLVESFISLLETFYQNLKELAAPYIDKAISRITKFFDEIKNYISLNTPGFFTRVGNAIVNFGGAMMSAANAAIAFLAPALNSVWGYILQMWNGLQGLGTKIVDFWNNTIVPTGVFQWLINAIDTFAKKTRNLSNSLIDYIRNGGLVGAFQWLRKQIAEFIWQIKHIDLGKFIGDVIGLATVVKVLSLALTIRKIIKTLGNLSDFMASFPKALKGFTKGLAIKRLSTAILMLTASLFLLAQLDLGQLLRAGAVLLILSAALVGFAIGLDAAEGLLAKKELSNPKGMIKAIAAMLVIAGSALLLAIALKKISTIGDFGTMMQSVVALLAIVAILTGGAMLISMGGNSLMQAGIGLLALVAAILLIVVSLDKITAAFKKLSGKTTGLKDDVLIIAATMTALAIAIGIVYLVTKKVASGLWQVATVILSIGITILLIAFAVERLTKIDNNALGKAAIILVALVGAIAVLAGIAWLFPKNGVKGILGMAAAIMAIGIAVSAIVGALVMLTMLGPKAESALELLGGIVTMLAVLLVSAAGIKPKTGGAIFGMAALILAIVGALVILAHQDYAKMLTSAMLLGAVLLVLGRSLRLTGAALSGGKFTNILGIIGIIATIAGSLYLLTRVDAGNLFGAVIAMSATMLVFAYGMKIASNALAGANVRSLIAAIASFAVIALLLAGLASMPTEGILAAARGLSVVMLVLAFSLAAINKTSGQTVPAKTIASMIFAVGAMISIAAALAILAQQDTSKLISATIAMATVLAVLAVVMPIMSRMEIPSVGDSFKMVLFITAVLAPIALALGILASTHIDANRMVAMATAMAEIMVALAAPIAAIGLLGKLGSNAMLSGTIGFIGIVTALGAFFVAIGSLTDFLNAQGFDLVGKIDSAKEVMISIGSAVGGLIGGLVTGFGDVVFDSLAGWGEDIKTFLASIEEGIDGLNQIEIDEGKMSALESFGKAILALTGAEILDGIAGFIGKGTSYSQFADEIAKMGPSLKTFATETEGIDGEKIKPVAEAINALSGVARNLGRTGGLIEKAIGKPVTLGAFASELATAGPKFNEFAQQMNQTDSIAYHDDKVKAAAGAIQAMADVAKSLGTTGGLIQLALGKPVTLGEFAGQLAGAIPDLQAFAAAAPGLASAKADIEKVAGAIGAMIEVANALTPEHEENFWTGHVKDAQTLGEFFDAFSDSGVEASANLGRLEAGFKIGGKKGITSSLVEFANQMAEINLDGLDKGVQAINKFIEIGNTVAGSEDSIKILGGLVYSKTSGQENGLKNLSDMLKDIAPTFSEFASYITGNIDLGAFELFTNAVKGLANAEVWLSNLEYGGGTMETFAAELWRSAESFANAANTVSGASLDDLKAWLQWITENYDGLIVKGKEAVKAVQDGMNTAAALGAIDVANNTVTPVMEQIASAANLAKARNAGKFLVDGFAAGITANIHTAMAAADNLSEATIQQMRRTLRIDSPSRVARQIGDWTGEGFTLGVSDWLHASGQVGDSLAESVTKSAAATVDYLTRLLNGDMVVSMTIHPVLDLTDVRNGAMTIDSMFTQRQALMAQMDSSALDQSNEIAELVNVSWQILREIQNGRDIYLDGRVLAGSMNRRLGRMEGL